MSAHARIATPIVRRRVGREPSLVLYHHAAHELNREFLRDRRAEVLKPRLKEASAVQE